MAELEVNDFYRLRNITGRPKLFKTPSDLAKAAETYFVWCVENPLTEQVVHGKDSRIIELEKPRPFTIRGLCIFHGMNRDSFYEYEKQKPFSDIITRIRDVIYNQKIEGATIGVYNANIIARDLGLSEKVEQNRTVTKFKVGYEEDEEKKD